MSKRFKIVSDEKEYRWSEKFIPFKELKKAILQDEKILWVFYPNYGDIHRLRKGRGSD